MLIPTKKLLTIGITLGSGLLLFVLLILHPLIHEQAGEKSSNLLSILVIFGSLMSSFSIWFMRSVPGSGTFAHLIEWMFGGALFAMLLGIPLFISIFFVLGFKTAFCGILFMMCPLALVHSTLIFCSYLVNRRNMQRDPEYQELIGAETKQCL